MIKRFRNDKNEPNNIEDFVVYLESAYSIPPVHSRSRHVGVIH